MLGRGCIALLCFALGASSAPAGDIYRYRTADGRILFSDNPVPPENTIESSKLTGIGGRLLALVPGLQQPGTPDERDRAQEEVRTAEADLMQAYNRLTADVLPRQEELVQLPDVMPVRGKPVKLPKTPEYYERINGLKADINRAQERLDQARQRYYAMQ